MTWLIWGLVVIWAALGLRQLKAFKLKYAEAYKRAFAPLDDLGREMDEFGRERYDDYTMPMPKPIELDRSAIDEVNDIIASMIAGPFFSSLRQDTLDRLARMEKEDKELASILRANFHGIREALEKQDSEK